MSENNLDDKARAIQEVGNHFEWKDIPSIINRVKQLDKGLISEDEFIYILNWSKKCKLIHKLDQFIIPPNAKKNFMIPDLFVIFEHEGRDYPCFIEIKTSKENKLSWTEQFYNGYLNYSKVTEIPILVAWKWSSFDLWTLFNLEHFEKSVSNYKIDFSKAHRENRLSKLAGDFLVAPYKEFAFTIRYKKDRMEKQEGNKKLWQTTIESVFVTGLNGKEVSNISPGIFSMLFSFDLEDQVNETEEYIEQIFIPSPNSSCFAQSIPVRYMKAFGGDEINWLSKIKDQKFLIDYDKFLEDMKQGVDDEVVEYILFMIPNSEGANSK